jgi:hypothetical protein
VSHRVLAGLLLLAAPLAAAIPARAQSPLADTARLQGQFELTGRITVAKRIRGEHVGETAFRTWTFSPLCAAGPCQTVALARRRQAGTDTLVLHLVSADRYSGRGRFYVPLRCGRRTIRHGESVPFRIGVHITAAALDGGVPVATQLTASYVSRKRKNLTRCVARPGHDAAVYTGTLGQ